MTGAHRFAVEVPASAWWRLAEQAEAHGMGLPDYAAALLLRALRTPRGPEFRVELDAEIRRLHGAGLNNSQIAQRAGTNRELVRRRLREWGLPTNAPNARRPRQLASPNR